MQFEIRTGNCIDLMRAMPDSSVDSIVTDPPYELGFMGKAWDASGIANNVDMWREALRVLKPGGHLLAFSGSRTYHRMTCAIEDAGFEVRDQIMWVYGCLDEQTEVATAKGVMPYHKTKVGDLVMCYDAAQGQYSYQPILEIVEYEYSDTAYRLVGDFGEQVVSRNHRCIVERGGIEVFEYAETLQREARVPVLEDLPALQRALHDAYEGTSNPQQDMWGGVCSGDDRGREHGGQAAGIPQGKNDILRGVLAPGLEAGCLAAQGDDIGVQPAMQRRAARGAVGNARAQGAGGLVGGGRGFAHGQDDGAEQPRVEGRGDVHQAQGSVRESGDQVRALPGGLPADGAQGRVRDGTPAASGASGGSSAAAGRGGAPYQPHSDGQPTGESDAVCDERAAQGVRAWGGHKTAVVRVVPFHYTGKVWCLRVPTGAFVAVRNGVAFPTGNSGFPKSLDVSKAIDKAAGAVREVIGQRESQGGRSGGNNEFSVVLNQSKQIDTTAPATDAARQWEGWGTALKPAHEPICVARKPLAKGATVAANVLAHGTGALNIDGCRVATNGEQPRGSGLPCPNGNADMMSRALGKHGGNETSALGRWPANLIHSGEAEVLAAFPVEGNKSTARFFMECKGGYNDVCPSQNPPPFDALTAALNSSQPSALVPFALVPVVNAALPEGLHCSALSLAVSTTATASDLKLLCESVMQTIQSIARKCWQGPKPVKLSLSLNPANAVVHLEPTGTTTITITHWRSDGFAEPVTFSITRPSWVAGAKDFAPFTDGKKFIYCAKASRADRGPGNTHPTVKPQALMRYLVRLVTPPGGLVLDPFAGSGSTGKAAVREGFRFIGCELSPEYVAIAEARIEHELYGDVL